MSPEARIVGLSLVFSSVILSLNAQELTYESAIARVRDVHPSVRASKEEQNEYQQMVRVIDIPKTDVMLMYGQYNSYVDNDNNLTISQSIPFPTTWAAQRRAHKARLAQSRMRTLQVQNEVIYRAKYLYQHLLYLRAKNELLVRQDSLFEALLRAATLRLQAGETNLLEKTAIETRYREVQQLKRQNMLQYENTSEQLKRYLVMEGTFSPGGSFGELPLVADSFSVAENPTLRVLDQEVAVLDAERKISNRQFLPDLTFGYFNQTLIGTQNVNGTDRYFGSSKRFQGFSVGVSLPLFFQPYSSRARASASRKESALLRAEAGRLNLTNEATQVWQEMQRHRDNLSYYKTAALPNAVLLRQQSVVAFQHGEIDYSTHLNNLRQVVSIEEGYLDAIWQFNQSVISFEFITGTSL